MYIRSRSSLFKGFYKTITAGACLSTSETRCPLSSVQSTNIHSHIFISHTHKTKKMNHTVFAVQLILLHYNLAVKS